MNLFALTSEAANVAAQIDAAAERLFSEDPADVAAATAELEQLITAEASNRAALTARADAWCWVIDQLRSQADAQREHSQRLARMAEQAEHRAQVMQDQLIRALSHVDPAATRWELPSHKLASRSSIAVEIDPDLLPGDLPEQFRRTKITTSADKTALAAALKAGETVPGCTLTTRRTWSIK
jgi:Siphovirus Gp157